MFDGLIGYSDYDRALLSVASKSAPVGLATGEHSDDTTLVVTVSSAAKSRGIETSSLSARNGRNVDHTGSLGSSAPMTDDH